MAVVNNYIKMFLKGTAAASRTGSRTGRNINARPVQNKTATFFKTRPMQMLAGKFMKYKFIYSITGT
jgi:hypothetical protein